MLLKKKLNDIKTILKRDNVLSSIEERYCYAKDALNTNIKTEIPDLVVFVETIEDVQKVVKYANQYHIPIIARGAGTNMVGACVCNKGGIVLNFSKMNKIIEINETNMYTRVQPGVILGDLKKMVNKVGLEYPPDPSNYKVSTVGGSIAQSSGGALAFKYGTTKDYVLSLKVVTAQGELLTLGTSTTKDAAGYHLSQLMVGSEGTLAIIVEATLKLIPKPESKAVVLGYFMSIDDTVNAVNKIVKAQIFPAAIDFMDSNAINTTEAYINKSFKTEYQYLLLIDLDGDKNTINNQMKTVKSILLKSNAQDVTCSLTDIEYESIWNARHSSYAAATRLAPDVVSEDLIVPRNKLSTLIKECQKISEKYSLKICMVGHIGDGNIHPQFVLDLNNEEEFRKYCEAKSYIYKVVNELGGSISAEHGIGLEKLNYLQNIMDKNTLNYMISIKKVFDPKNILNPGKIFNL